MKPTLLSSPFKGVDSTLSVIGRKNSADEILKDKMSQFVEKHLQNPCKLLLISGDVDFSRDLAKFRFSHGFKTALIHNNQAKDTLKSVIEETISMDEILGIKTHALKDPKRIETSVIVGETQVQSGKKEAKKKKENKNDHDKVKEKMPNPVSETKVSVNIVIAASSSNSISNDVGRQVFKDIAAKVKEEKAVDVVFEESSFQFDHYLNDESHMRSTFAIKCGKKKAKKCSAFIENLSDDHFLVKCLEVNETSGNNNNIQILTNENLRKNAKKELNAKIKKMELKHKAKIKIIEKESMKEQEMKVSSSSNKLSDMLQKAESSVEANVKTVNLKNEKKDLENQLTEFKRTCTNLLQRIEEIDSSIIPSDFSKNVSNIKFLVFKEMASFENPLPIYKFRKEIQV